MLIRVLAVFLFFAIFTAQSFTQDTSEIEIPTKTYALQFQITDNFSFSSFQGATFSGKYHLADGGAIRLGVNINAQKNEIESDFFSGDTLLSNEYSDASVISLTINMQSLFYSNVKDNVAFYYGGGPFVKYYKGESSREDSDGTVVGKNTMTQWGAGLGLVIGGEWFVRKNIGLSLEYGLTASYNRSKAEIKESNRNLASEQTKKDFKIAPSNVLFGVSIYF